MSGILKLEFKLLIVLLKGTKGLFQVYTNCQNPRNVIIRGSERGVKRRVRKSDTATDLFRCGSGYCERGQVNAFERDDWA